MLHTKIRSAFAALCATVLGAALLAGGPVAAQQPANCDPAQIYPYGRDIRQISRNLVGVTDGAPAITYFMKCDANGEVTRYTYRQPITIDMTALAKCDETEDIQGKIVGFLYTETRLTDPYTASSGNTRIGRHAIIGRLIDPNNNPIASVRMDGTIGTNSSRPPLKIIPAPAGVPVPDCFECDHFTGMVQMTFIQTATVPVSKGIVFGFYQFDAIRPQEPNVDCDKMDWCDNILRIDSGTLDGINYRKCQ